MKKIIIGIGIVLVGLALYLALSSGKSGTAPKNPSGLSPFGDGSDIPALGSDSLGQETSFDDESLSAGETIFRLSNTPVAGFTVFARGGDEIVRFADRGTGHIADAALPRNGAVEKVKITNRTLPKIYEAVFRPDGGAVLFRSLNGDTDSVSNLSLALAAPKASSSDALYTIAATNLRGNIDSVTTLGNSLLYVLKDSSSISTSNFNGEGVRNLFSSPFTSWKLGRLGNNILAATKPSASAPGYAYSLPAAGGPLTRLLGPLQGLAVVASANGGKLLYSYNEGGMVKLFTRTIQSGSIEEILPPTLAEKCLWSAKQPNRFYCGTPVTPLAGNLPDDWHLGLLHTTDYIWSYDMDSQIALIQAEPKTEFGVDIDVYKPALSPQEDFLIFINKRDLTLWAVKLK